MRRALKVIGITLAILIGALIAYETYAVVRAKSRTPAVLAEAAKGELKLSDLPPRRIAMIVQVEDPGFYRHHGFDYSTPGASMTSITQSLVKHFYFAHFHKGFPKIEQTLIAWLVLDPTMSKADQLKAYLNFTYFGSIRGRPVIGYADAARTYYGRELGQLSDHEFVSLLAMTMAPNALDPLRHRTENAERVRRIEALLAGKCQPTGVRDVAYEAC